MTLIRHFLVGGTKNTSLQYLKYDERIEMETASTDNSFREFGSKGKDKGQQLGEKVLVSTLLKTLE